MKVFYTLLAITIILFVTIVVILWNNSSAPKATQQLGKLLSLLLAAIAIISIDFFQKREIKGKTSIVTLQLEHLDLSSHITEALRENISDHTFGYECLAYVGMSRRDTIAIKSLPIDLFELGLFRWLAIKFPYPYYEELHISGNIQGTNGYSYSYSNDEKPNKINGEKIRQILDCNGILLNNPKLKVKDILVPKGTTIETVERTETKRTIVLGNKFYDLVFNIQFKGSQSAQLSTIPFVTLKRIIGSKTNFNNKILYKSNDILVTVEAKFKARNQGNKESIKIQTWTECIINQLKDDFDWSIVKADLKN